VLVDERPAAPPQLRPGEPRELAPVTAAPLPAVRPAVPTRELHPIIKRIIEAMVADIIAEEDQAKRPTCIRETNDQQ
jgi:hypothetical protein